MHRPEGAFEWLILIIVLILVATTVTVLVIAFNSDQPLCPEGEDYVFSHYISTGRVLVPQYVCR